MEPKCKVIRLKVDGPSMSKWAVQKYETRRCKSAEVDGSEIFKSESGRLKFDTERSKRTKVDDLKKLNRLKVSE